MAKKELFHHVTVNFDLWPWPSNLTEVWSKRTGTPWLGQRSLSSTVIVRTQIHTHMGPSALPGPLMWSVIKLINSEARRTRRKRINWPKTKLTKEQTDQRINWPKNKLTKEQTDHEEQTDPRTNWPLVVSRSSVVSTPTKSSGLESTGQTGLE